MIVPQNVINQIHRVEFSLFEPLSTTTLWAYPVGQSYDYRIFLSGQWTSVADDAGGSLSELIQRAELAIKAAVSATEGAENVNATLIGNTLTVTDREGKTTSITLNGTGGGGYEPPVDGIPKTDLAADVQASLGKADTALQSFLESDPTVPSWAKTPTKPEYDYSEITNTPTISVVGTSGKYKDLLDKPSIPTNTSDLNNNSGFITNSVNNLLNYYLKSETYTKTEVGNLIAAIQQFHYEMYISTSDVASPSGNVLYLIGPTGTGSDKYEEYVYDSTKQEPWIKIGDTSIDLSGYVTTTALNTALADYTTTANLTTLLAGKQNVIDTTHKLSADLVDDTNSTHKFVTAQEKANWNNKSDFSGNYNDLSNKPTIPDAQIQSDWNQSNSSAKDFIKNKPNNLAYIDSTQGSATTASFDPQTDTVWTKTQTLSIASKTTARNNIGAQEALVSGTNIKTINNESILGSGNISVAAELPSNLAYTSNDNGEGIIPSDGIRAVTVTSAAAMSVNPDVVTVINGAVGTATITLQVPNDNLAHVWDILMTTDSSVAITFAMSNSATILYPNGFAVGASKAVEISVIGVGTKYYLRYGEFA